MLTLQVRASTSATGQQLPKVFLNSSAWAASICAFSCIALILLNRLFFALIEELESTLIRQQNCLSGGVRELSCLTRFGGTSN